MSIQYIDIGNNALALLPNKSNIGTYDWNDSYTTYSVGYLWVINYQSIE